MQLLKRDGMVIWGRNDLVIDKILDLMAQTLTTVNVMVRILVEGT